MIRYIAILAFLLLTVPIFAQTGSIEGAVTDALTNEPIAFATVAIPGTTQGAITDETGKYVLDNLVPGLYAIQVSYVGYEQETRYEIQVSTARPVAVNFRLQATSTQLSEVVVKAAPFKKTEESPVSLRTIGVAEIQRNPGVTGISPRWYRHCLA
jgi:uncharacterized membrane protein